MRSTRYNIIILLTIILGCNPGDNPYKDIDFQSGNYRLFFIGMDNDVRVATSEFKEQYPNFYIDNIEALSQIRDIFFNNPIDKSHIGISYEILIVDEENKTYFGGWLDIENYKMRYSKTYNLDFERFYQYRSEFKELSTNNIKIKSIGTARKLVNQLEKSGGYVYGFTNNPNGTILDFDGSIKVLTNSTQIDNHQSGEQVREQIMRQFSKYGRFKLGELSFMKQDSFELQFYCDSNFYDNIKGKYQIIIPFTDSIDYSFKVFDLHRDEIVEIVKAIGIEELEYIE